MALIDWLEFKVKDVGSRIGAIPIQWPHERHPGLVWRIPEPESVPKELRVTAASIFSNKQPVLVREYERAVVLESGRNSGELEPGVYDIAKARVVGQIEIIWALMRQMQLRWGVGGILTGDSVEVGAHGLAYAAINNASQFVLSFAVETHIVDQSRVEAWLKGAVSDVMRTEIAARDVMTLQVEREAFIEACGAKLARRFAEFGMEFRHLEIGDFNIPPAYKQARQAVTLAGFEQQKALIDAHRDAQIRQIQASAEANARLALGSADVEVMALLQRQGIDPVKMKMIETLMEYAKNPSSGDGAMISGDLYKPQVFAMLTRTLVDPQVPEVVKSTLREKYPEHLLPAGGAPPVAAPAPAAPPSPAAVPEPAPASSAPAPATAPETPAATPPATAPAAELTREQIQQTIDNLDMRLAAGEIKESTYEMLVGKWHKKLAELDAG
jgi:regulator of protease activity HflC (stomatin/prohibitin superfamily)